MRNSIAKFATNWFQNFSWRGDRDRSLAASLYFTDLRYRLDVSVVPAIAFQSFIMRGEYRLRSIRRIEEELTHCKVMRPRSWPAAT